MQDFILTTIPLKELTELLSEVVKVELANLLPISQNPPPPDNSGGDLVTRKEAAKLLGVSFPTLNRWTKDGTLTGYRINTRVRYKRAELEQSLKTICKHNQ